MFGAYFSPQAPCNSTWRRFNSFTGLTQNSQREKCWSLEGPPLPSPASLLVIGLQIKRSSVSVFNEKSFIHNQASNFLAGRIGFYQVILKLRNVSYLFTHAFCFQGSTRSIRVPSLGKQLGCFQCDQRERRLFKM